MNYKMRIGSSENGAPLIGAEACNNYAVVEDYVFPSQFAYRCTARDKTGAMQVCTPTAARQQGWEIVSYFPAADGSLSGRR
jgi:hypothetical protein